MTLGIISDHLGVYKTALGILGIVIISITGLIFSNASYIVFISGGFLLGLSAMGVPVLAPLLTKDFFGEKNFEMIYSNVLMGAPLATIILLPLFGFIFDMFQSYFLVFLLLLGITAIGIFSVITGNKKKLWN